MTAAKVKKPITAAWRANVLTSFKAAGVDLKQALPTLNGADFDWFCRAWAYYVDHGLDFGSAALKVLDSIDKADAERIRAQDDD